jgi:hypothetical protein
MKRKKQLSKKQKTNETKKTIKKKEKSKKNANNFKLNQCPHCDNWFPSANGVYDFHLIQCKTVQESITINIHQESYCSKPLRNKVMPLNQISKQYSNSTVEFSCFTNRLSRIDLKHHCKGEKWNASINSASFHCPKLERNRKEDQENQGNKIFNTFAEMNQETIYDSHQLFEKAWTLFEAAAATACNSKGNLQICHIPFPPSSLSVDGLCVFFGLDPGTSLDLKRARMRKLLIRW